MTSSPRNAIISALIAALLFGASTPFAKRLSGDASPVLLAGLLYLGSGMGLWTLRLLRLRHAPIPTLSLHEWLWFFGAVALGGVVGPVLLMQGLQQSSAASASLLLNLEAVFTALFAWVVFRENTDRRLVLGMFLIIAGGAVLAWPGAGPDQTSRIGLGFVAGACLCWGLDNNLTRHVSAADADFIAGSKGLIAGATNITVALALGAKVPVLPVALSAMSVGFLGYGASLVLFVIALRGLGSARAGAYFSTAPFLGAAIAIIVFHETAETSFLIAALLMATGVVLHVTERHSHAHTHEELAHSHPHGHDEHHQHEHEPSWDGTEPHTHPHRHAPLTHEHPHFPDLHHRHGH